jgi:arginyl-tRNA synthetase
MKRRLESLLRGALCAAIDAGELAVEPPSRVHLEEPSDPRFGDAASNVAMVLAKSARKSPRAIAQAIIERLQDPEGWIASAEIAGPGFINLTATAAFWRAVVRDVLDRGAAYGRGEEGAGRSVLVEFVSANPTGPLHVGHGRGAVIGDVTARLLAAVGHPVVREYYVNDFGRQMEILGRSTLARCRELAGEAVELPADGYPGEYLVDVAKRLVGDPAHGLANAPDGDAATACARGASKILLGDIRRVLDRFGVRFDRFVSERTLHEDGRLAVALAAIPERLLYERDDALFFRSSEFGDEKDRAVRRSSGVPTYFGGDLAHFHQSLAEGHDRIVNVFGADHHGYVARLEAAISALGGDPRRFEVVLVQMVNLTRGGQPVRMGKRAGEFVALEDVLDEVGVDAARVFFLLRRADSQLDFDLELATQQSTENPVYYVQYAHARIASILRQAAASGTSLPATPRLDAVGEDAAEVLRCLLRYPEVVEGAAETLEPHRLVFFLLDLAGAFHRYYNQQRVLVDDPVVTEGRLALVVAVHTVLRSALDLVGVSAPDRM